MLTTGGGYSQKGSGISNSLWITFMLKMQWTLKQPPTPGGFWGLFSLDALDRKSQVETYFCRPGICFQYLHQPPSQVYNDPGSRLEDQ